MLVLVKKLIKEELSRSDVVAIAILNLNVQRLPACLNVECKYLLPHGLAASRFRDLGPLLLPFCFHVDHVALSPAAGQSTRLYHLSSQHTVSHDPIFINLLTVCNFLELIGYVSALCTVLLYQFAQFFNPLIDCYLLLEISVHKLI